MQFVTRYARENEEALRVNLGDKENDRMQSFNMPKAIVLDANVPRTESLSEKHLRRERQQATDLIEANMRLRKQLKLAEEKAQGLATENNALKAMLSRERKEKTQLQERARQLQSVCEKARQKVETLEKGFGGRQSLKC